MQKTDGFPGDSDGKRILLQCRRPGFNSWVGSLPWRREWKPTPVFLPEKFHGQKSLAHYSPWCHKELDMNEWLTLTLFFTEAEVVGNTQMWVLLISFALYAEFLSCTSGPCPEYQSWLSRESEPMGCRQIENSRNWPWDCEDWQVQNLQPGDPGKSWVDVAILNLKVVWRQNLFFLRAPRTLLLMLSTDEMRPNHFT